VSERDILIALWHIGRAYALEPYFVHYDGDRMEIEGLAHEFAHALEGGRDFESRIRSASDARADEHERTTLRIEVAALRALGMPVSLRRLWPAGNWRGDRPPWRRMIAPLTTRERRCARRFVSEVRRGEP
jgi:hypothetical protein